MITLLKDQTLKQFWQQRNGLRMKLKGLQNSIQKKRINNMTTADEQLYMKDIDLLIGYILEKWNDNKKAIDIGLKQNE